MCHFWIFEFLYFLKLCSIFVSQKFLDLFEVKPTPKHYFAAPNFWPSAMPAVMTLYCYYIAAPNFGPSAMPAVYLQNKRCFEIVHFYDKINLILNPAGRIFMTQMTLMCTVVFIRIRYYCVEFTPSGNRYGYKTV